MWLSKAGRGFVQSRCQRPVNPRQTVIKTDLKNTTHSNRLWHVRTTVQHIQHRTAAVQHKPSEHQGSPLRVQTVIHRTVLSTVLGTRDTSVNEVDRRSAHLELTFCQELWQNARRRNSEQIGIQPVFLFTCQGNAMQQDAGTATLQISLTHSLPRFYFSVWLCMHKYMLNYQSTGLTTWPILHLSFCLCGYRTYVTLTQPRRAHGLLSVHKML